MKLLLSLRKGATAGLEKQFVSAGLTWEVVTQVLYVNIALNYQRTTVKTKIDACLQLPDSYVALIAVENSSPPDGSEMIF